MSFALENIQAELSRIGLDGWLFYEFNGRDPITYRILKLPYAQPKRRWYYFIPAQGTPQKLVHKIEATALDSLPGEKRAYASWEGQHEALKALMAGATRIAMQYSPENAIPYVSMVDAGTIEVIRGLGKEPICSADLIQQFESLWTSEQVAMHREAGAGIDELIAAAFARIGEHVRAGKSLTEYEQQQWLLGEFSKRGLVPDGGPDIAINEHSSDPHFEPSPDIDREFRQGDWVLHDVWAKVDKPGGVFYDVCWVAYIGAEPPAEHQKVFDVVREARDTTIAFVLDAFAKGREIRGFEVDDVARNIITKHGYGEYFFHRTGHSIGEEIHSTGANMDNLETHDDRVVLPGLCFSIEPGIYLPDFGIRLEVNVITSEGKAEVSGPIQDSIILIQ